MKRAAQTMMVKYRAGMGIKNLKPVGVRSPNLSVTAVLGWNGNEKLFWVRNDNSFFPMQTSNTHTHNIIMNTNNYLALFFEMSQMEDMHYIKEEDWTHIS